MDNDENYLITDRGFSNLLDFIDIFTKYIKVPFNLHLTGGEPLIPKLEKYIFAIIAQQIKSGNTFSISTNFSCHHKLLTKIQGYKNFAHFNITFLTTNPAIFSQITSRQNALFETIFDNIIYLDTQRNNRIQITVCKDNLSDVWKTVQFLKQLPLNQRIKIVPAFNFRDGQRGSSVYLDKKDMHVLKDLSIEYKDVETIEFYRCNFPGDGFLDKCTLSNDRLTISTDGSITLCGYLRDYQLSNIKIVSASYFRELLELIEIEKKKIEKNINIKQHCVQKDEICGFGCRGIAEICFKKHDSYDPLCKKQAS